jgi:hypothetical protein
MMGVDLLAIVDSYYQIVKSDWNSDEHKIARSLLLESSQDRYDNLLLKEENKKLKAQRDQAVEALEDIVNIPREGQKRTHAAQVQTIMVIACAAIVAIAATEDE